MRVKLTVIIFLCVLLVLSCIQMTIDWIYEKKFEEESKEVDKKPEYLIFIEVEDKVLYLLQDGKCIKKYPIASGKPGYPSPIGEWRIVEKGHWGGGFGGRWLGLNVPWGKYGIHGTTNQGSIGRAASHGCIRMFNKDIRELYSIVPHGTVVAIVNGPFGPFGRGFRTLEPGDRGADIMAVQKRLKALGFYKGYVSGIYNDDLKHALHRFQREKNLKVKDTITRVEYEAMGFREME